MPKPPIDPVRWTAPPIDPIEDFGPAELTIVPVPGDAPEDVVVDGEGFLWTGLVDGRIVRIHQDGSTHVVGDTGGRPLGLEVSCDGRLLICDSPRGLLAMSRDTGTVEVLADSVDGRLLRWCSNVIEMPDGTIYFTESSSRYSYAELRAPMLEARADGSLLRRDVDGSVTTVLSGLYFTNGVASTADGSALVFAESQARRLSKYWLAGPQAGTVTDFASNLPCMPDNLSTGDDGRIWCAMFSGTMPALEWLTPRAPLLRRLAYRLPDRLQLQIEPIVWVVAFDPESGEAVAGIHMTHPDFGTVTGVVERDGRLWLSSIGFPALAHCALP